VAAYAVNSDLGDERLVKGRILIFSPETRDVAAFPFWDGVVVGKGLGWGEAVSKEGA